MVYEGQVHRFFTGSKCDDLYEYPLTFPIFPIFDVLQYISPLLRRVQRLNYGSSCRYYDLRWLLSPGTRCPKPKLCKIKVGVSVKQELAREEFLPF
jgi:hypothetical protein